MLATMIQICSIFVQSNQGLCYPIRQSLLTVEQSIDEKKCPDQTAWMINSKTHKPLYLLEAEIDR